ncbi:MAG: ABC transporter ATP-binding protein [Acidobacteriota bacterium]
MLIADSISKHYDTPRGPLPILDNVSVTVDRGESVAVMGPSGCGKSTLLYILGALEPPTSGVLRLGDVDPYALDESGQAKFRNTNVGFVFQDHLLLPQLSALDNVLVPTLVASPPSGSNDFNARARQLLADVGLEERLDHRPGELSGGERQRVAIARALILQPSLLLCDEPTGNLDRSSAEAVAALLVDLHRRQQTMLVVVTHSPALAARFSRRYELDARRLRALE